METFSALVAHCEGNSPVTVEFPSQRPVTRSLRFSLICAWINAWVNNCEAGDLRSHRAHYVIVMWYQWWALCGVLCFFLTPMKDYVIDLENHTIDVTLHHDNIAWTPYQCYMDTVPMLQEHYADVTLLFMKQKLSFRFLLGLNMTIYMGTHTTQNGSS